MPPVPSRRHPIHARRPRRDASFRFAAAAGLALALAGSARAAPATQPATSASAAEAKSAFARELVEIRRLRDRMAFARALRRARKLQRAAEGEKREKLRPLIAELRKARRKAPQLRYALEQMGKSESRTVSVAGRQLLRAGELGRRFLRHAVRDRPPAVAGEAARLLARAGDEKAAAVVAKRLEQADAAWLRRTLVDALVELAPSVPRPILRRYLQRVRSDDALARTGLAAVLTSYLAKACGASEDVFNDRLGRDGAYQAVRQYVKRARRADDPELRAWGARQARRFDLAVARGQIGFWSFEGIASGVAADRSGRGRAGRVHGARRVDGLGTGHAAGFDGDDYIAIPAHDGRLDFQDELLTNFTISLWFRTTDPDAGLCEVIGGENPTGPNGHDRHIHLKGGDVRVRVYGRRGSAVATSGKALADGRWHHLAVTLDKSTGTHVYVDGALAATAGGGVSDFTGARGGWSELFWILGHSNDADHGFLDGALDHVRVYDRVLSQDEIRLIAERYGHAASAGSDG